MKYILFACSLLFGNTVFAQTANFPKYNSVWELIGKQEFRKAEKLISDGAIEPGKTDDAYITGLYLKTYLKSIDESQDFVPAFYSVNQNPDPYVYALWFTPPVIGAYGKKKKHQLAMIHTLFQNPKTKGTLTA